MKWFERPVPLLAIARRELLSLFVTPLGYGVGTLFLLLQGWDFALLLRVLNDPLAAPGPVMQFYFGGSFFIFWLPVIFICAALSMRLVVEERRQGTLEALLTTTVSPAQIVLGKYLAAVTFYVALWIPTGVFYVLLRGAAVTPDPGPVAAGYLGTVLVGASFLGLGLMISALSRTHLGAAVATFVSCTVAVMAGLLSEHVGSDALRRGLEASSVLAMMQELAQGIVDVRWLWLHGAVIVSSLAVGVLAVNPRRSKEGIVQVVLLVFVVVHVAMLGTRWAPRLDWTGGQVYALSARAQEVLAELDGPIDVRVLVPTHIGAGQANPVAAELREVLRRMRAATTEIRVRFVDPDRDRQEAEQLVQEFGLAGRELADGVVLIRAGQGRDLRKAHRFPEDLVALATGPHVAAAGPRVRAFLGEEALLSAFIQVTDPRRHTVCVTQGHGEPELDNFEPYAGYAHFDRLLRDAGFDVRVADTGRTEGLAGCDVVVVAGPRGPLPADTVDAIVAHGERGGAILLLAGATVMRGHTGLARHGLEEWAAGRGIVFGDRVVLDPHGMPGGTPLLAFTLSQGYGDHPAVRSLIGRPVSLVFVRELSLVDGAGIETDLLLQAGEEAWAEAELDALAEPSRLAFDQGPDRSGPIPVAVASQRGASRLVVVGSDQFALNAYLRPDIAYDHGRDLLLNVMAWLTDRPLLVGVRAREREHVKLVLRPEQLERMTWVCLLAMPGFVVLLGASTLWRRRRR